MLRKTTLNSLPPTNNSMISESFRARHTRLREISKKSAVLTNCQNQCPSPHAAVSGGRATPAKMVPITSKIKLKGGRKLPESWLLSCRQRVLRRGSVDPGWD